MYLFILLVYFGQAVNYDRMIVMPPFIYISQSHTKLTFKDTV